MTIDEALNKFRTGYGLCKVLGVSTGWIPQSQQLRLEKITGGELRADEFGPDRRPIGK